MDEWRPERKPRYHKPANQQKPLPGRPRNIGAEGINLGAGTWNPKHLTKDRVTCCTLNLIAINTPNIKGSDLEAKTMQVC